MWNSIIFELLALKKMEVIIKFGVDVDIGLCFYQQIIGEEINVCIYQIYYWLKILLNSIGQRKMNLPN